MASPSSSSPAARGARPWIERLLPIVGWARHYDRRDLSGDLIAGLVTAVMLVPQGMAYALLAGLPPVVGLYASVVPLLVYAMFGSSRQLAVGPVAIVSLLTLSGVGALAEPGSAEFVALAAALMLMVGLIQAVLGLLRAGFVVNFLSHAVISGFTSAAALVIGLSQAKHLLGIPLPREENVFVFLFDAATKLGSTHGLTLAIGAASIGLLLLGKRLARRFPTPLVVVIASSVIVWALGLHERGVAIVGDVPAGLPLPGVPDLSGGALGALLPAAATIAFVGFMESVAVAKAIAAKHRAKVDANRELIGLGLANVAGAFFRGYPVTGGFSRSAVNDQAGARTPLAGIVTAVLIALTLLFLTDAFYFLPQAVLAAIVMVAVFGLIDLQEPRHLWRVKKVDALTLAVTFLATLSLGVETGILTGVAFSLLVFVGRSAWPHTAELGWLPSEGVFRNVDRYPQARTWPELYLTRPDAALYFANMAAMETQLNDVVAERPQLRAIVLDFAAVNDVDGVALDVLRDRIDTFAEQGIEVHLAGVKGPVRDVLARAGWPERYGTRIAHLSVAHALRHLGIPLDGAGAGGAGGSGAGALGTT
ncbi:MAG: sulfate permease [Trueperaceae bacterium]|nr:sulfate permease [Trueperaceae bacterium]